MDLLLNYKALPRACRVPTKMVLVMKLTAFFLLVGCLHLQARSIGQQLTLSASNKSLTQVFSEIEKQSGYQVFYNDNLLNANLRVSVQLKNASLPEALKAILKDQPLDYSIVNKTIVIKEKKLTQTTLQAFFNPPAIVEGEVKEATTGKPLAGVTVLIKGSNKSAMTDNNGHFAINAGEKETLVFSYIGHADKEVRINGRSKLQVELDEEMSDLEQMVVVGYGSMKRKDLTGSVSSVNMAELKNTSFTTFDAALAGKAAGVQVVQADGSPGGVAKIRIRGGTSLIGGNDPLYIIDGVQVTVQNRYVQNSAEIVNPVERVGSDNPNSSVSGAFARGLNSLAGLNISDIESIDILKDASATAIYGSKAANGVVIITTKKGKTNQKPILEANYYEGRTVNIREKVLNADQYIALLKEGAKNLNDARAAKGQAADAVANNILTNPTYFGKANTDWLGLISRTGISRNADISVRGGGTGSRYYTSLAYTRQEGALQGTDFTRIAGKINLDNEISRRLRVIVNMDYGFTKNNVTNGIYSTALYAPPTFDPYNADGTPQTFNGSSFGAAAYNGFQNPLSLLRGKNEGKTTSLLGSLTLEYDILNSLKFRSTASVNYSGYHQLNYLPGTVLVASASGASSSQGGIASQSQSEQTDVFYENTLTWEKQLNKDNRINLLGGTSWQQSRTTSFSASGQGFPDDVTLNGLSSAAVALPPTASASQNSLLSFYLRGNYALKEKYLLTITGRSDASSKFPKSNRVGYFPSAGIAWRVSEESFLKNVQWLNELKLRASGGYTGTQNIGNNLFYTLYTPASYGGNNALVPSQLGNDRIKWESTRQLDLGLDFALFASRLRGTFGYYEKTTTGLLMSTPVAASAGFGSVLANLADIQNRGLELDLRGDVLRKKDFQWSAALNISGNRSKVLKISTDIQNPAATPSSSDPFINSLTLGNTIIREGQPVGLIYGATYQGLIRTQKQLDDYKASSLYAKAGIIPYLGFGDAMFKTVDTGLYKGYFERNVIGHAEPKFYGGFTNTFTYKGFSLIALLTYSYGGDILYLADAKNIGLGDQANRGVRILDHYTPENTGSNRPRILLGQSGATGITASSMNVYSASFMKLKSITLTYDFPAALMKKAKLNHASVYISASNLFTITHYPGADPEVSNDPYSLIGGYSDSGGYPTARQYNAGVRIGF